MSSSQVKRIALTDDQERGPDAVLLSTATHSVQGGNCKRFAPVPRAEGRFPTYRGATSLPTLMFGRTAEQNATFVTQESSLNLEPHATITTSSDSPWRDMQPRGATSNHGPYLFGSTVEPHALVAVATESQPLSEVELPVVLVVELVPILWRAAVKGLQL